MQSPRSSALPGHASIPELNVRFRDEKPTKRLYRILALELAELAGRAIVYDPTKA